LIHIRIYASEMTVEKSQHINSNTTNTTTKL